MAASRIDDLRRRIERDPGSRLFAQLAEQLCHTTIQMTMGYAKFHPAYADVGPYFRQVAETLGLSGHTSGHTPSQTEAGAKA